MRSSTRSSHARVIHEGLRASARLQEAVARSQAGPIAEAADVMVAAMRRGGKIIWFGNGGSATQSQHMAAEFVGRFCKERRSVPSISLAENMASVTAIANDYRYELIFARQLEGLGKRGDVAVGLSTSGSSANVLAGLRKAKELGLPAVGLTGGSGGAMRELCDICIVVPSKDTARIQESQLTIGHILCQLVEDALFATAPSAHPVGNKARTRAVA